MIKPKCFGTSRKDGSTMCKHCKSNAKCEIRRGQRQRGEAYLRMHSQADFKGYYGQCQEAKTE